MWTGSIPIRAFTRHIPSSRLAPHCPLCSARSGLVPLLPWHCIIAVAQQTTGIGRWIGCHDIKKRPSPWFATDRFCQLWSISPHSQRRWWNSRHRSLARIKGHGLTHDNQRLNLWHEQEKASGIELVTWETDELLGINLARVPIYIHQKSLIYCTSTQE